MTEHELIRPKTGSTFVLLPSPASSPDATKGGNIYSSSHAQADIKYETKSGYQPVQHLRSSVKMFKFDQAVAFPST